MKNRIIVFALCLMLLAACAVAETAGTKVFRLGTSVYTVVISDSFVEGERTEEEIQDDLVAYMQSEETLLDFDVYQFKKEGYPETLAAYMEAEAEEFEATELVTDGSINGINAAWYYAVETYEGEQYKTVSYLLEDGDDYVEIAFWLDGEEAEAEAKAIIESLSNSR